MSEEGNINLNLDNLFVPKKGGFSGSVEKVDEERQKKLQANREAVKRQLDEDDDDDEVVAVRRSSRSGRQMKMESNDSDSDSGSSYSSSGSSSGSSSDSSSGSSSSSSGSSSDSDSSSGSDSDSSSNSSSSSSRVAKKKSKESSSSKKKEKEKKAPVKKEKKKDTKKKVEKRTSVKKEGDAGPKRLTSVAFKTGGIADNVDLPKLLSSSSSVPRPPLEKVAEIAKAAMYNGCIVSKERFDRYIAGLKKGKVDDFYEPVNRWWEKAEELNGNEDRLQWRYLEHKGLLFTERYITHSTKLIYDGVEMELPPAAEEVAGYFVAALETYGDKQTFIDNFWKAFTKTLPENTIIKQFSKCDFSNFTQKMLVEREQKKNYTKEQKEAIKFERERSEITFKTCLVDWTKEKVGNFRIEPCGLFRGRGEHPKMGQLKARMFPEAVTINIGPSAPVPRPFGDVTGHAWYEVVHDPTVTWLADFRDSINGAHKYVFLSAASSFRCMADLQKYEKARRLHLLVDKIRADYAKMMEDSSATNRQLGTATYLIDFLALRVGGEKDENEADTVGCCSLRAEHISANAATGEITLDFLGKDSIRYHNTVTIAPLAFKNIQSFLKNKKPEDQLFDSINMGSLNQYLKKHMEDLSAKVFRTYNASITLEKELAKFDDTLLKTASDDPSNRERAILKFYNDANRAVAILCNHQRAAPKTFDASMAKMQDKLDELIAVGLAIKGTLDTSSAPPAKKSKRAPKATAKRANGMKHDDDDDDDDDIDMDGIAGRGRKKVLKDEDEDELLYDEEGNEIQRRDARLPNLSYDEFLNNIKNQKKDANDEVKAAIDAKLDKIKIAIEKLKLSASSSDALDKKLQANEKARQKQVHDMVLKDENKTVALGTSKLNYMDPRITVCFAKKHCISIEKLFNRSLRMKFPWAMYSQSNWQFVKQSDSEKLAVKSPNKKPFKTERHD